MNEALAWGYNASRSPRNTVKVYNELEHLRTSVASKQLLVQVGKVLHTDRISPVVLLTDGISDCNNWQFHRVIYCCTYTLLFINIDSEKSRNFGLPNPFFKEQQLTEKSVSSMFPPAPLGLKQKFVSNL